MTSWEIDIDQLSEAVNNLQRCLVCTICLELMTAPMKTRCGHLFCQLCIKEVLQKRNAHCPLCNKVVNRRKISKDDHMESCIQKFNKLLTAIQIDSGFDILSCLKQPRDTRESCSNSSNSQSSYSSKEKKLRSQSSCQSSKNKSKTDRLSLASCETVIGCDSSRHDWNKLSNTFVITLSDNSDVEPRLANVNLDNVNHVTTTMNVNFPDECSTSTVYKKDETRSDRNKILSPINLISDSKSDTSQDVCRVEADEKSKTYQMRKRIVDYAKDKTSRASRDMRTKQSGEIKKVDSSTSKLKYNAIHARIRTKNQKKLKDTKTAIAEETDSENSLSPMTTDNQAHQSDSADNSALCTMNASVDADKQPTVNTTWSSVIEFGKEMRTKKVKKLNVSTEKNKRMPKIVENIILMPNQKYNLQSKKHTMASVSNQLPELDNREQEAINRNLNSSSIKEILSRKSMDETRDFSRNESFVKVEIDNMQDAHVAMETPFITMEDGKQVLIKNLNNDEMCKIIGNSWERDNASFLDENLEENLEIMTKDFNSPSKRLTLLTSQKLNESFDECKVLSDKKQILVCNSEGSSHSSDGDRTFESPTNNSAQKISLKGIAAQPQSSNKFKLSLKRSLSTNENLDSPPLSNCSLIDRLPMFNHDTERNIDGKGIDAPASKDDSSFKRLTKNVRRKLSLQIADENRSQTVQHTTAVGTSSKQTIEFENKSILETICWNKRLAVGKHTEESKNQTDRNEEFGSRVKFMLGTLVKRHNVKYFYLGSIRRERSMPKPLYNLPTFPNFKNNLQDSADVIQNICLTDNLIRNSDPLLETIESTSATFSTCNITPKKNTDYRIDRKEMAESFIDTNRQSNISIRDTENLKKSSNSESCSNIKLLSPDKDSQLKFLTIDSPVSQRKSVKLANLARRQSELRKPDTKEKNFSEARDSYFATSASKASSSESSVFVPQFPPNQNRKKIRRIDDDESSQDSPVKNMYEEKIANQRSVLLANVSKTEKCENAKSSQKNIAIMETDSFDNAFNSANFNYDTLQQLSFKSRADESKASQKFVDPCNDDIINKVLQIERLQNNSDVRRSVDSVPQNSSTNQTYQNDQECNLLQDNYDEIIANVELPQSEDIIPCTVLLDRSFSHMLTRRNTSNCPATTNKPCSDTRDSSIIFSSPINDIFKNCNYSSKNIRKSSSTNVSPRKSSDEKDIAPCDQNNYKRSKDRRDMIDVTARNVTDVTSIDRSSRRAITSKNTSREEKLLDCIDMNESLRIDNEICVSRKSADQLCVDDDNVQERTIVERESNLRDNTLQYDSLMNVTQQEAQLQMFEEDLFGIARNRACSARTSSQDDPFLEEQHTPRKRKRGGHTKSAASQEHFTEEDDVVENTPETKIKKIADFSSSTSKCKSPTTKVTAGTPVCMKSLLYPLHQSTPKVASTSTSIVRLDAALAEDKKLTHAASVNFSLAKQTESKMPENDRQHEEPVDKRRLCFVCSGLTGTQITNVKKFARKYSADYTNQFDPSVTHVIVNTIGENNAAKSTLKYLQGIAHRKWVVSYKWVENCIKEERLLDETPYEATDDNSDGAGPRNSRLRDKDLFEGFTFLCVGPYFNLSLSQYQDLLLASGARVVDSLEALVAEKESFKVVVVEDSTYDDKEIEYWYRTARAAPISTDWIMECIKQYKLISLCA